MVQLNSDTSLPTLFSFYLSDDESSSADAEKLLWSVYQINAADLVDLFETFFDFPFQTEEIIHSDYSYEYRSTNETGTLIFKVLNSGPTEYLSVTTQYNDHMIIHTSRRGVPYTFCNYENDDGIWLKHGMYNFYFEGRLFTSKNYSRNRLVTWKRFDQTGRFYDRYDRNGTIGYIHSFRQNLSCSESIHLSYDSPLEHMKSLRELMFDDEMLQLIRDYNLIDEPLLILPFINGKINEFYGFASPLTYRVSTRTLL